MAYQDFVAWLGTSSVSEALKAAEWVVPTVQSLHILGIGVVLSCATIVALRLFGFHTRHLDVTTLNERLIPAAWWALLALFVTGAVLIVAEPTRTLNNPYFFAKVACLLVLAPLTRYFQVAVRRQPQRWAGLPASSRAVRPTVATAMLLLLAVVFCGRWIAYA